MKKIKLVLFFVSLLMVFGWAFGKVESADKKSTKVAPGQKILNPILIYDRDNLLEISIEDVGKYHRKISCCLTIAFRATQLAISQLWGSEIPKRGDFEIISACPSSGSKAAFEFITRVITRKKVAEPKLPSTTDPSCLKCHVTTKQKCSYFKVDLPEGTNIKNMKEHNFTFTLIRKSTKEQIKIWLKEGVFPEGFFELRKKVKFKRPTPATPDEKRKFKKIWQKQRDKLLYFLPTDKLFDFEIVRPH